MQVLLIYPPASDPTYPYPAVPLLVSHLKANGYANVKAWDANLALHRSVLTSRYLSSTYAFVAARKRRLEKKRILTPLEKDQYVQGALGLAAACWTKQNIDHSVQILRTRDFFSYDSYVAARRCIQQAYRLASAECFPASISADGYAPGVGIADKDGIHLAIRSLSRSLLGKTLIGLTGEKLVDQRPQIIGFSVTYKAQFVPALVMAALTRRMVPRAKIVWGGVYASRLAEVIGHLPVLWDWIDFFVWGNGQKPLEMLLNEIGGRRPSFERVPNLIWIDKNRRVHRSQECYRVSPEDLPAPDYSDFDLSAYLSPEPVLGLPATSGCYWHRCRFCSYGIAQSAAHPYCEAKPETVVRWMKSLNRRYGVRHFTLAIDVAKARWLSSLADKILASRKPFFWHATMRADENIGQDFFHHIGRAGCRLMVVGLESAVPSVLMAMQKGIHLTDIGRVLKGARKSDVALTLQVMLGYPGETEAEASETLRFMKANAGAFAFVGLSKFDLLRGSSVFKNPQGSGIRVLRPDHMCPAQLSYDYEVTTGWSRDALKRFFRQEALPAQRLLGTQPYPFLESGATAHTLLSLSNTPKDKLVQLLRGGQTKKLAAPPMSGGPIVACLRKDTCGIHLEWSVSPGRHGESLTGPLHRRTSYLMYEPESDSFCSWGSEVQDVLSALGSGLLIDPEGVVGAPTGSHQLYDLLHELAAKGIVSLSTRLALRSPPG